PDDGKAKGFKISYHFEPGMEKPEIKIEGSFDDKKIREYLKNVDISKFPHLKDIYQSKSQKEIDASELSLDYHDKEREEKKLAPVEPYTEITNKGDFTEVLIEIPGVDKGDVSTGFKESGKKLVFTAESKSHRYLKIITLPFNSSKENLEVEVNNGIAVLKVRNKNF
ncbi:MAG: hypothetical protein ACW99L_10230, partial [Promethearchaeota archaeon]